MRWKMHNWNGNFDVGIDKQFEYFWIENFISTNEIWA